MRSLFSLIAFLGFASFASAQSLCNEISCSEGQKSVQQGFDAHTGFNTDGVAGHVYSGACYHTGMGVGSNDAHTGLTLLESTPDGFVFRGVFGFFVPPEDYANLTYEQALKLVSRTPQKPILERTTEAYVLYPSSVGNIEYWLRSDGQDLFLLGRWILESGRVYNFCKFTRNLK